MSDQTEREAKWSEAVREAWERNWPEPVIALADQERAELEYTLSLAEQTVRQLEAALQQSRDDHQGAVEKLRAVEAEWRTAQNVNHLRITIRDRWPALARALNDWQLPVLASPVESDADCTCVRDTSGHIVSTDPACPKREL